MTIKEQKGSSLVELGSIISDLTTLKEMADKTPPAELPNILPPQEHLAKLEELTKHLLFLHGWQEGMMLTEKYRKKPEVEKKKCTCQCHTWGKSCAGFGPFDNSCCEKPHEKYPEWAIRIDPIKKKKLIELFREQSKQIHGERDIEHWISKMDIPVHIKSVLHHEIGTIGLICANCGPQYRFDVKDNIDWVLETLEKFL